MNETRKKTPRANTTAVAMQQAFAAEKGNEARERMRLQPQLGNEELNGMFLREAALMVASGIVLGLVLAILTGKIVSGLLYQVGALDPIAFTIAPLVLAAATLLATWLPARRAARVDPMTALRAE